MRVMDLLTATVARAVGLAMLSSAASGCGCPDEQPFNVDEQLTAYSIDKLLEYLSSSGTAGETVTAETLTCEQVCSSKLFNASIDGIASCEFDIDGYVPPPTAPIGSSTGSDASSGSSTTDHSGTSSAASDRGVFVGSVQCEGRYTPVCIGGRRPLGHSEMAVDHPDPVARTLAAFASIEAASIDAFIELGRQLKRWRAPRDLIERCEAAARDEAAHADTLARFAQERGANVPCPQQMPAEDSLLAAATHNATEGCVHETWAALLAHHQSAMASLPELRNAYQAIAADETRHGQLAWDLHRWFLEQLEEPDREHVLNAQRAAIERLSGVARRQAEAIPNALGCPAPAIAGSLAEAFCAELHTRAGTV